MSLYLNCVYDDGEKQAIEIATVQGWADWCRYCEQLPPKFMHLKRLAKAGTCDDPVSLKAEMRAGARAHKPGNQSAKDVGNKLYQSLPDEGTVSVSQEPEDDEFDDEEA